MSIRTPEEDMRMQMVTDEDRRAVIRELEVALNVALVTFGYENLQLRYVLMQARGDIREALGEART